MVRVPLQPPARRRSTLVTVALLMGLFVLLPAQSHAIFWAKRDWKDGKHKLKVCVKDPNNKCPANMVDSVKAAIDLWNAEHTTWQFSFEADCDQADIVIQCAKIGSLGETGHDKGLEAPDNTRADMTIKSDADWGWCADKYELVSTICHELGHCARLRDTKADKAGKTQESVMRGAQGKPGHHRGPSRADSIEAATSDTAKALTAAANPRHGEKQQPYFGRIVPEDGTAPFDLGRAIGFQLRAYQPEFLQIFQAFPLDPNTISWGAVPAVADADMQLFFLVIQYPESTSVRPGILNVTDVAWQPGWMPHAVAPRDTLVPDDTSQVILDASNSSHPAGEVMSFGWVIDDGPGLEGGPVTSTTFPAGEHILRLIAIDQAGLRDTDTMVVTVLRSTGVGEQQIAGGLRLGFPSPFLLGRSMPISLEIPGEAEVALRIFDVQGRLVRTVFSGRLAAGRHEVAWDTRDAGGKRVAAGVYLCSLRAGRAMLTRKMVVAE